jgi:hypothetical protein
LQGKTEYQSSSGILVSTGAGSTGWISSVFNMAGGLATAMGGTPLERIHMDWEDPRLFFVAREPFISRHSTADLVTGWIGNGEELLVESTMPSGGCVFSDGIEADSVELAESSTFNARQKKRDWLSHEASTYPGHGRHRCLHGSRTDAAGASDRARH